MRVGSSLTHQDHPFALSQGQHPSHDTTRLPCSSRPFPDDCDSVGGIWLVKGKLRDITVQVRVALADSAPTCRIIMRGGSFRAATTKASHSHSACVGELRLLHSLQFTRQIIHTTATSIALPYFPPASAFRDIFQLIVRC